MGDLSSLWAESRQGGNDLGHVGGSSAILGASGSDRGGGKASDSSGSDSSSETHFEIRCWVDLLEVVEVVLEY